MIPGENPDRTTRIAGGRQAAAPLSLPIHSAATAAIARALLDTAGVSQLVESPAFTKVLYPALHPAAEGEPWTIAALASYASLSHLAALDPCLAFEQLAWRYPSTVADELCERNRGGASVVTGSREQIERLFGQRFVISVESKSSLDRALDPNTEVPSFHHAALGCDPLHSRVRSEAALQRDTAEDPMTVLRRGVGIAEWAFNRSAADISSNHIVVEHIRRATEIHDAAIFSQLAAFERSLTTVGPMTSSGIYEGLFAAALAIAAHQVPDDPVAKSFATAIGRLREHRPSKGGEAFKDQLTGTLLGAAREIHLRHRPDLSFEDVVTGLALLSGLDAPAPSTDTRGSFAFQRSYPKAWLAARRDVIATYTKREDLPTDADVRNKLTRLRSALMRQCVGLVATREQGLGHLAPLDVGTMARLDATGAMLKPFTKLLIADEKKDDSADITRYAASAVRQFSKATPLSKIRDELVKSGNYPAILRECARLSWAPSRAAEMVKNGSVDSLVMFEYFAAELEWKREQFQDFRVTLEDVADFKLSLLEFAKIDRHVFPACTILLFGGYQGRSKHVGSGDRHIREVRLSEKVVRALDPSSDEGAFGRLMLDGVFHAAQSASCWIASSRQYTTHKLVTEKIRNGNGAYTSLILAPVAPMLKGKHGGDVFTVITAIVHRDAEKARSYLVKNCSELASAAGAEVGTVALGEMNRFFSHHGIAHATRTEVGLPIEETFAESVDFAAALMVDDDTETLGAMLAGADFDASPPARGATLASAGAAVRPPPRRKPEPMPPPAPPPPPLVERILFFPQIVRALLTEERS